MKFKITSLQTVKGSNMLYADVEFLDDAGQVVHLNDFIMQISPTQIVYIGPPLANDESPDPKDFEEQPVDVEAVITSNITRYAHRYNDFAGLTADNRDASIERDNTDPLDLKADPKVTDLIGTEKDIIAK